MYQNLTNKDVVARKEHQCDWCGNLIRKGEKYNYQTFIHDGEFNDWHSHLACSRVVSAIWDYCEPYDGLDSWGFDEGCCDVCRDFVCPDCQKWDEDEGCADDKSYCIDKLDEFFKTHELYATREKYYRVWRARKKEETE